MNRTVISTILMVIAFVGFNSWVFTSDTMLRLSLIAMALVLSGVAMIVDPSFRALMNGQKKPDQSSQGKK